MWETQIKGRLDEENDYRPLHPFGPNSNVVHPYGETTFAIICRAIVTISMLEPLERHTLFTIYDRNLLARDMSPPPELPPLEPPPISLFMYIFNAILAALAIASCFV